VNGGRRLVRWRDDAFEMRCDGCREWWELEPLNWPVSQAGAQTLALCRDCYNVMKAIKQREYRKDAADVYAFKNRLYYRANKERVQKANRRYKAAHREEIREKQREYRARVRAERQKAA
jgi:hypothetical protein